MLKINDKEITGVEKATSGDTRMRAFCNHPYIKFLYGTPVTFEQFKINGVPAQFAAIGTRPRFKLRKQLTASSPIDFYVYRDSNSAAIACMYGGIVETLIPAEENVQYIVVEVCGGGGGGSGGGALLCGTGGGSGAFALLLVDMSQYSSLAAVGQLKFSGLSVGGTGVQDRDPAGSGPSITIKATTNDGGEIIVHGGGGSKGAEGGDGGTVSYTSLPKGVTVLYQANGTPGHAEYSDDYFAAVTASCGISGESECEKTYGPYSVESNASGAGASSHLGPGAPPPSSFNSNGNDATSFGAGGSGGSSKAFSSTKGGNGGPAVVNIYY